MASRLQIAIVIFFSSLSSLALNAQSIDSIMSAPVSDSIKIKYLDSVAFRLSESNPVGSIVIAKEAMNIALKSKNDKSYADCLNTIGWAYFRAGKHDSAQAYLLNAKMIFHKLHDTMPEVRVMNNIGSVYSAEGDYTAAMNQLSEVMRITGSSNKREYAVAEKMIGIIYRKQGDFPKAKLYLRNAASDFLSLNQQKYYADAVSSLGILYQDLGDADSALYCYRQSLKIYLQLKNVWGAAIAYEDLGVVSLMKNKKDPSSWLDSAQYYFTKSYYAFVELNSKADISYEKYNIGEVLFEKKQYAQAKIYIEEALAEFESAHDVKYIKTALKTLSELYADTRDYTKAYSFLIRSNTYNDTLNAQGKDKAVADMLVKYEADKKDRTITLLNTQNALLSAQKQLAERTLYKTKVMELFILTLIIFSLAFTIILWNRYRIKQELHEMQMRIRISNDLHDDVGSSLSSILLLSNIAADANGQNPEILGRISENAREVIERMSEIIWTTNPNYDDGENLRSKIMNYVVPLCQIKGITINVNISDAIKNIKFSMEMRKNIFLIIKEAMNNILKHSQATEINFTLLVKEKNIILEIADNGKGFDINNTHKGNGLETMNARAIALGGNLSLETKPGNGTKILATLPLSRVSYFALK